VFSEPFDPDAVDRVRRVARVTLLESTDEAALIEAVGDCHALVVRTATRVTRQVIERAGRLRVIGRGGVGLDNVDIAAARERGIEVVSTPGAATEAVADLTVGLILALVRRIVVGDAAVRAGGFVEERRTHRAAELSELTLGIVGMGRIGKAVGRRCYNGFGMRVVYNDIVDVEPVGLAAESMSKEALFRASDVVSLHVPLTGETRGLIDAAALAKFQRGALLVNTARGAVVDGAALADALASGRIGGAGLDVFDPEPPPVDHPLLTAPNTCFSPHVGARTRSGLSRMNGVVDEVIRILREAQP
jgi:phosphoglycerate dehydrogenase-like enzyme